MAKNREEKIINRTIMDKQYYRDVAGFRVWRDRTFKTVIFVVAVILFIATKKMGEEGASRVYWYIIAGCWIIVPVFLFPVRKAILSNQYEKMVKNEGVTEKELVVEFSKSSIVVKENGKKTVISMKDVDEFSRTDDITMIRYQSLKAVYMRTDGFNTDINEVETMMKETVEKNRKNRQ